MPVTFGTIDRRPSALERAAATANDGASGDGCVARQVALGPPLVAAHLELVDHRLVERGDVARVSAGDHAVVADSGIVRPRPAGVADVGLEAWPRGERQVADDVRLDQQPRRVADRCDRLVLLVEVAGEGDRARGDPPRLPGDRAAPE